MEALIFDVFGEYGCFRIPYTTTSVVSYPFPPRTAITGLVAAILGLKKESYEHIFNEENSQISIQVLSPLKKIRVGLNLNDTKHGITLKEISKKTKTPRTQIPFEFIKDCNYRIYIWLKDKELFNKLEEHLSSHTSVYTPYLGVAFGLADFKFIGKYKTEKKSGEEILIHSVVPKKYINNMIVQSDKKYLVINRVPHYMNNLREVTKFEDFIYEAEGKPILFRNIEYDKVKLENEIQHIIFF